MNYVLPILGRHKYPSPGACIYCGATKGLTSEHIVPYGLGGNIELLGSSCSECAKITSKFELAVLRGPMRPVRQHLKIQSRSKYAKAPPPLPLKVISSISGATILNAGVLPLMLHFPIFPPPAFLFPSGYSGGIGINGIATYNFGLNVLSLIKKGEVLTLQFPEELQPWTAFAKMLAKIAFAMAHATGAINLIHDPSPVLPAILGQKDDIDRWVGTLTEPSSSWPHNLHRIAIVPDESKGLLIGDVQLFSESPTPRYGVIIGRLIGK